MTALLRLFTRRIPATMGTHARSCTVACLGLIAAVSVMFHISAGSAAGTSNPISILAPTSFTSTTKDYVCIIASTQEGVGDVSLSANGGPAIEPLRSDDEVYHFRVKLALGLNVIDIKGVLEGEEVSSESLGLFKTSKIGTRIRSPFPDYVFHTTEVEQKCGTCHAEEINALSGGDGTTMNRLCLKCHTPLISEEFVHGPIAVGTCAVCHSFTSAPNKYQLNQESFDLCLLCHEKKAKALKTKRYTHGPLGAALCDICHEPHSSPNGSQLRQPGSEICMVCHKALEDIFQSSPLLHKPFEQRKCTQCHDPHYSDHPFLMKKGVNALCRSCHEEAMAEHKHPYGVIPRQQLPFEALYGEEGELICVTCHDPHGANAENLLPEGGCPTCHPI